MTCNDNIYPSLAFAVVHSPPTYAPAQTFPIGLRFHSFATLFHLMSLIRAFFSSLAVFHVRGREMRQNHFKYKNASI